MTSSKRERDRTRRDRFGNDTGCRPPDLGRFPALATPTQRLATETTNHAGTKALAAVIVPGRAGGHGDGTDAIELVAKLLLLLPCEELVQGAAGAG